MQLGTICYLPKAHDPAVPHKPYLEYLADAQQMQPGPGPLGSAPVRDPSHPSHLRDILCIPCHGFQSDWHLARALVNAHTTTHEEAAIQNVHIDTELLALLSAGYYDQRKRVQRLGSLDRRVRLLAFARREQLTVAMPYCDGSAMRCEAVLKAKYRSSLEQAAAGNLGNVEVPKAGLGGCPALALRALQVAEGTTQLEESVALIAKEQEAKFRVDCNLRLDAALDKSKKSEQHAHAKAQRKKDAQIDLLHFAYKYGSSSASDALLASANAGGENVHRNEVFGLLLGASQGKAGLKGFEEGLKSFHELDTEIAALIKVLKEPAGSPREL
eukprot:s176_g20.t1